MLMNKREYVAARTEAKVLSEIDKNDITKAQAERRKFLYDAIAEFERKNRI